MVELETHDNIALIFLDDGLANVLNATLLQQLQSCLQQATSQKFQALVLSGSHGFFSAGLDLKTLPSLPAEDFHQTLDLFETILRSLLDFPLPTVAALNGHAVAGGAVLALTCDQALAAAGNYRIGLNESAIGVPLPRFILQLAQLRLQPRSWLRALVAGSLFSVEESARIGFVDEVVPPEMLLARAKEQAQHLAEVAGPAYFATRRQIYQELLALPPGQLAAGIDQSGLPRRS